MNVVIIDIEANNLYPYQTAVWTIVLKRVGGARLLLNPFKESGIKDKILDFIFSESEPPIIVGHNFLGFDGWVLWKDFDCEMRVGRDFFAGRPCTYVDTLYLSQYLLPDRLDGHSLESWGNRLGSHKIDYRTVALQLGIIEKHENEFVRWSPQMDEYCIQDCEVTEKVYLQLTEQLKAEGAPDAYRLGQKNFFLMAAQAFTGFKFDIERGIALKARVEKMIVDLKAEVEPELPPRKLKKAEEGEYQIPAKPYLQNGEFSANMLKFIEKHKAVVLSKTRLRVYDHTVEIVPHGLVKDSLPMLLSDQNQLKDFFLDQGWEPTLWNVKKIKGKPVRPMVKTSPKVQENGKICPNLLELDGELPKKIVRFMSLRNRLGILTGWLEHPRLLFDGRLPAGSTGIASTHRQKHTVVVNIPKAQDDVLLGREFRELFTVEKGNKLVGCDQAALEARCEAHWVYKYPGGEERAEILISKDVHATNTKVFFPEETKEFDINSPDFSKDHPGFKPYRSLSKNGAYCLAYGGSAPKLAQTLRKPKKDAKKLFDAYWAANPSLKTLKDKIEYFWEREGEGKWVPAIDGRRLHSRSKHSLVNLVFQSTGAIIVDYALCLFDMKMGGLKIDTLGRPYYLFKGKVVKRTGYNHDEALVEVDSSLAEEIAKIFEWCMAEAGIRLKLNVPTVGEAKIGLNWAETH